LVVRRGGGGSRLPIEQRKGGEVSGDVRYKMVINHIDMLLMIKG